MSSLTITQAKESWPTLFWDELVALLKKQWPERAISGYNLLPLAGGHSRDSLFTLSADDSAFVLRMALATRQGGEQVAELSLLAGNAGLGPKVYFKSDDSCVLLMEEMPGQTVCIEELKTKEGIKALGCGLKKIHQLPAPAEVKSERLFSNVYQWQQQQTDYAFLNQGIFEQALMKYQVLAKEKQQISLKACLLHGDINPSNIFLKDRCCYFIDWEFSGIGHPVLELARTCEWFAYDDKQMTLFLESYLNQPLSDEFKQSIVAMRKMTYLEMFWLCLSFLPAEIISEQKLLTLMKETSPLTLNQMAANIEKGIQRHTDNESILTEAVGFFKTFMQRQDP